MLILVLLGMPCVLGATAPARTWHVAPGGSGDAAATPEKPLRSLDRALALAGEGDVIKVAAGTYAPASNVLPFNVNKPSITIMGGFDPTFTKRDPFGTPSLFNAPAEFDKPLLTVTAEGRSALLDGLTWDGGTHGRYGSRGLQDGAWSKIFALVKVERAQSVTVRGCSMLNSPGHALSASVTSLLTLENNVMVNSRVSAVTAWGVQQGAALVMRQNTIMGVWAEKPLGERGDGVDVQRHLKATLDGNVVDDVAGACVRLGMGNETPTLLGNALGRCGQGALRGWPQTAAPMDLTVSQWESTAWLDAKLNVALTLFPPADPGVTAAHALLTAVHDGGKPPAAPPYAARWTAGAMAFLGLDARAGARLPHEQ